MKNNPTLKLTSALSSMLIPNLNRKIATVLAGFLVTCGAFTIVTPIASANGCTVVCGGVQNRTGRTMSIIEDPIDPEGSSLKGPPKNTKPGDNWGYCYVWNWDDDYSLFGFPISDFDIETNAKPKRVYCNQNQTINYGIVGGFDSGTDIDSFTFANEGYHERFNRLGTWHWREKGVWTRIHNNEIADCGIGDGGQIWCTVLVQVPVR